MAYNLNHITRPMPISRNLVGFSSHVKRNRKLADLQGCPLAITRTIFLGYQS